MANESTIREEDIDWSIPDDPPPVMGTWSRLYILVLAIHSFVIFLFWLFTHAYS